MLGDTVSLRGMRFHARVGILPHEREFPQPLEIDLTVWLRPDGPVVDYRGLYDDAATVVAEGPLHYLEEIAEAVAARALARPRVARVQVAVRKPHVALAGPLDHAEVTVVRPREVGGIFR
ncbi:MAG TPA: dihydroneopterin aldolase [Gemmatimonadaceae bacterium]|nr:dihydroneopterin aldolase [Gemmatimonadaceae bacterium]